MRQGAWWVPLDADAWEAIAGVLPRPWPREAVLFDLRWWLDQRGEAPSRRALMARWGWGEKAVRLALLPDAGWADPRRKPPKAPLEAGRATPKAQMGPSEGPARAQMGPNKGPDGAQPGGESRPENEKKGPDGAQQGPNKGPDGAQMGPNKGPEQPNNQPTETGLEALRLRLRTTPTPTPEENKQASGPVQPVLVAPVEVQPPTPTQSDVPLELPKPKRARPTAPVAAPSGPGLPAIPGWASSTGLPRERGTGRDLAGVVLRTVARVTGRPLPAPWGLEGEAMPGQGVRIDPEASTEATQVVRLLRALAWPDLREWEGQASAVAAAFHRCPDRLFAHDVRAVGWPEGVDRSRDVATFVVQKRWASRVDAALRWWEREAAATNASLASTPPASVEPAAPVRLLIDGPRPGTPQTWEAGQSALRQAIGPAFYDVWVRGSVAEADGWGPLLLRVRSPAHATYIADNYADAVRAAAGGSVCLVA